MRGGWLAVALPVIGALVASCGPGPGGPIAASFGFAGAGPMDAGPCADGKPFPGCACFAGEKFACPSGETLTCPPGETWGIGCGGEPFYDATVDAFPGDDAPPDDAPVEDSPGADAPAIADGPRDAPADAPIRCVPPDADGGSCAAGAALDPAGCCRSASLPCVYPLPQDSGACAPGSLLSETACILDGLRKCAPCASILVRTDSGIEELSLVSDAGTCPSTFVPNNGCCAPPSWVDGGETTRP
ncbi:MAG TPA: hypothetical protein VKU41_19590 [Polyangiaceae bacterium]|nr:hypothetical protein [Polyangiaceae bacterium]